MPRGRRDYARRERMRDMARRRRDMARRRDNARREMESERYSRGYTDNGYGREYMGFYGDSPFYTRRRSDFARGRDNARGRDRAMGRRNYRADYGDYRDYAGDYGDYGDYGEDVMSPDEFYDWYEELAEELEEPEKEMFSIEKIEKKAEEMGIKFKEFSPEALAVATLMTYTDYGDVLGKGNMDLYIKLGKAWLCDEDSELQYEEKLTAYKENVVTPED